ncbi:MAG: OmpA family protein [Gemmatimonadota bacterium]
MNRQTSTLAVSTIAALSLLSACATNGALERGLAAQRAVIDSQRVAIDAQRAALESERVARASADSVQRAETRREMAALRSDLQGLRTEFGAKIAEVAQGLQFMLPVHFAFNDATVRQADLPALDRFAAVVRKHYPGARLTVEGFADPSGGASYNLKLSKRRADAVKTYVAGKGVDAAQITAIGMGKARPVVQGATRDKPGAELNRRVVFVIETPPNSGILAKVAASGL